MSYPSYPGESEAAPGFPRYGPQPLAGEYPAAPPGYYYGPPPQPARGLMIASIVIAAMITALAVIEAALAWPAQSEYLEAADQGKMSYDVWTAYDFAAFPFIPLGIAAYVITCLWLYKVRTNYEILSPGSRHARSRGWAWGGWVCPIVNFWFPFQIVRDVARDPRQYKTGNTVIGWWWAFWLLSQLTTQIGPRLTGLEEIDEGAVSALGTVETIDALVTVTAFVLWMLTVRRIGRLQDELMGIAR